MNFLYWQDIDRNNFDLFVRDLSQNLNSNVKNIVIDTYNDLDKSKIVKSKKQSMKKKDIIIREQTQKRIEKLYKIRPHRRITEEDMKLIFPEWNIYY